MNFSEEFDKELEENMENVLEVVEMFWQRINKETKYLTENSVEYANNQKKMVEISQDENLKKLFNLGESCTIDIESSKKILEYLNCLRDNNILEEKRLFLNGAKTMFYLMNKLEILKSMTSEFEYLVFFDFLKGNSYEFKVRDY